MTMLTLLSQNFNNNVKSAFGLHGTQALVLFDFFKAV